MCKSEIFNRILNTVYLGPADQHNFPQYGIAGDRDNH